MKNNTSNTGSKENAAKRNDKSVLDVIATVCIIVSTLFFMIAVATYFFSAAGNKKVETAYTGEEMLNGTMLYGIENVEPFDIVENAALYKAQNKNKEMDEYAALALALAEYRENALYKYAYEAVGDSEAAAKYQKALDASREKMQVSSYADYIDRNYNNFRK